MPRTGDLALKNTKKSWLRRLSFWLAVGLILYQAWILGHVVWWVNHNLETTAFMREGLEKLRIKNPRAQIRQQWVPYSHLSVNLKRALIASEDETFAVNDGFDWQAMGAALVEDIRHGHIIAGGSTITQQLAKNLFLSQSRTPWRKLQEFIITVELESFMSKRRILDIYLNVIQWGNGVYGAEAAAHHYYGTSAANLSVFQAARLAAMVPDPIFFDKHRNDRWLAWKTGIIMARMSQMRLP